jgi:hypothetical protein
MRWERGYPPKDESAAAARKGAAAALAGADDAARDDALLVIGELVSNAIRHAATDLHLSLVVEPGHMRVEVFDADPRPPALLAADVDATSGRGLIIVASLARTWGYGSAQREGLSGKIVWAELDQRWRD